jgi:hypothetical protein
MTPPSEQDPTRVASSSSPSKVSRQGVPETQVNFPARAAEKNDDTPSISQQRSTGTVSPPASHLGAREEPRFDPSSSAPTSHGDFPSYAGSRPHRYGEPLREIARFEPRQEERARFEPSNSGLSVEERRHNFLKQGYDAAISRFDGDEEQKARIFQEYSDYGLALPKWTPLYVTCSFVSF